MLKQRSQNTTSSRTATSADASARASPSGARRMWKVSRCAVFGPIPGRRLNASISFSTGSMSSVATVRDPGWVGSAPEQPAQAAQGLHRAHLLLRQAAGRVERLVDRGGDEVLEHLDVIGVDRRGVDRHRDERLLPGGNRADDPAARGTFDLGLAELGLDSLHLLLHLRRHALQVAHAHRLLPYVRLSLRDAGAA